MSKLDWRCRRGTKELDVLLQRYLANHYPTATPTQRSAFETLLDQPDPDLQDYFSGHTTHPDPETRNVIQTILTQP